MKGKRIWIRQHPNEPSNYEISLTEPEESHGMIYSIYQNGETAYVPWVAWVAFQLDDDE